MISSFLELFSGVSFIPFAVLSDVFSLAWIHNLYFCLCVLKLWSWTGNVDRWTGSLCEINSVGSLSYFFWDYNHFWHYCRSITLWIWHGHVFTMPGKRERTLMKLATRFWFTWKSRYCWSFLVKEPYFVHIRTFKLLEFPKRKSQSLRGILIISCWAFFIIVGRRVSKVDYILSGRGICC